jgi:hypothetical protein
MPLFILAGSEGICVVWAHSSGFFNNSNNKIVLYCVKVEYLYVDVYFCFMQIKLLNLLLFYVVCFSPWWTHGSHCPLLLHSTISISHSFKSEEALPSWLTGFLIHGIVAVVI